MFQLISFTNLKADDWNFHLPLFPYHPFSLNVRIYFIESGSFKKLLGLFVDTDFSFEYYMNKIWCKGSQDCKIHFRR